MMVEPREEAVGISDGGMKRKQWGKVMAENVKEACGDK